MRATTHKVYTGLKYIFKGPDSGALTNTKRWKDTTPPTFSSPFIVQGDVGFIAYRNKTYGRFVVFVQTYTRRLFAVPLKNLRLDTLINSIDRLVKVCVSARRAL